MERGGGAQGDFLLCTSPPAFVGGIVAEYIGPNGEKYSTNSIRARISRDAQEAADRIIAQHEADSGTLQISE